MLGGETPFESCLRCRSFLRWLVDILNYTLIVRIIIRTSSSQDLERETEEDSLVCLELVAAAREEGSIWDYAGLGVLWAVHHEHHCGRMVVMVLGKTNGRRLTGVLNDGRELGLGVASRLVLGCNGMLIDERARCPHIKRTRYCLRGVTRDFG